MAKAIKYDTSRYDDMIKKYNKQVDSDTRRQVADAKANATSQLRQAYVSNIQNKRNTEQALAQAGIRGGMTETANLNLANQYGATRGQIRSDLSGALSSINNTAQTNKNAYALETESARNEYIENRQAEDRVNAREDALKKVESREKFFNAHYSTYYDTDDLDKLKKKWAQKANKEKNATKKADYLARVTAIEARIGYIKSNKKGY